VFLCAATCILLLRRKRSGVRLFFVTYSTILVFSQVATAAGRSVATTYEKHRDPYDPIWFPLMVSKD
jgi:hypothetical protein